jgi:hypothetical protein
MNIFFEVLAVLCELLDALLNKFDYLFRIYLVSVFNVFYHLLNDQFL